ncbi:hypothetical protein PR048_004037 [Dryococelus australis]|uniref:Uncharacterized protein n=1 Tax=Dryococelus australis TaxID=614101 RepID=A0ABQ9I4F0_9NEOP|nr:hypothetical protein PR048_004037 [Dryococelus australis]
MDPDCDEDDDAACAYCSGLSSEDRRQEYWLLDPTSRETAGMSDMSRPLQAGPEALRHCFHVPTWKGEKHDPSRFHTGTIREECFH